jgi:2,3-bisphosphoglycerate-independent phosphoglycerate mutase
MKILYIVLDGLGDLPNPQLGNKTPLAAAHTPFMDTLAAKGKTGLVYTVERGIAPESDVAVISILGYDAKKYYTGRGPLECYAAGLDVKDGDLAYRVNFATLGNDHNIVDRRVGRNLTTEEATELSNAINSEVQLSSASFHFKNTIGHRGVLVIRSDEGRLSAQVTNTDPAYEKEGVYGVAKSEYENVLLESRPVGGHENLAEARKSALLTNEFIQKSHELLNDEPVNKKRLSEGKLAANVILTRDSGDSLPKFPPLDQKFGKNFGCFVEMPVERGIALLTGMKIIDLPEPTADPAHDYPLRAKQTLESIRDFDGLYIHIKGPDEPAHDGRVEVKKASIASIDQYFFGNLLPHIDLSNTIVAVTADHSTPCSLKAHSDDPVPLLIAGGRIEADGSTNFSEKACSTGSLGELLGPELMPLLIEASQ